MTQIPQPPPAAACATCVRPLVHLWSPRHERWITFATDPDDRDTLHVHRCHERRDERNWRTTTPVPPERVSAGADRVRAALGWNQHTRTLTTVTRRTP